MGILFLSILITVLVFILASLFSIVRGVSRIFVRSNNSESNKSNREYYNAPSESRKRFGKDEGKYVGFEELKED